MISVRRSADRGRFDHGWLDTRHTFSFAGYHDPEHMGFRDLRVINEDTVRPGEGFGTHPHRDMEIMSYVVSGALEHRDSLGNGAVLRPGEVQVMSAGRGVTHSEFNPSRDESGHFLQIWVLPARKGTEPRWDQKEFPLQDRRGVLRPVVSPDGRDGSLTWGQDVTVYASILPAGAALEHAIPAGRHAWIQIVRGALDVGGTRLAAGDGAAVSDEGALNLVAAEETELLLFDLR
jgi:redox-sensitive bicupin YhaK (pirin superfamily)